MQKGIILSDRDEFIFRILLKFRYCTTEQIATLAGFPSMRSCYHRIKKLTIYEYIEARNVIYGIPRLLFLGKKARKRLLLKKRPDTIRMDTIKHDLAVIDTVIFLLAMYNGLSLDDIQSERQLHADDGFGNRRHRPDLVIHRGDEKICIEVEFTSKESDRFLKNLSDNFMEYDKQIWFIPTYERKIRRILSEEATPNTTIYDWEKVRDYVQKR